DANVHRANNRDREAQRAEKPRDGPRGRAGEPPQPRAGSEPVARDAHRDPYEQSAEGNTQNAREEYRVGVRFPAPRPFGCRPGRVLRLRARRRSERAAESDNREHHSASCAVRSKRDHSRLGDSPHSTNAVGEWGTLDGYATAPKI